MTEAPYLTPADVARELQISRAAAYRVCRESFGALKVPRSTFKRWIVDRTLPGDDGAEELARRATIYLGTIDDLPLLEAPRSPGVYFVRGADLVKIGHARDVRERISTLQTGSPVPLVLLAMAHGGFLEERDYHHRFRAHRAHGEWFSLHEDLAETILEIRSGL